MLQLRFEAYEKRRKQKLNCVSEAMKQGRLEELRELSKMPRRPSSQAKLTRKSQETLRVPLDHDFIVNKKLARQVYEQELLERQRESRSRQQEQRTRERAALQKLTEDKARKAEKYQREKVLEKRERREQTAAREQEMSAVRRSHQIQELATAVEKGNEFL